MIDEPPATVFQWTQDASNRLVLLLSRADYPSLIVEIGNLVGFAENRQHRAKMIARIISLKGTFTGVIHFNHKAGSKRTQEDRDTND
jgi:hypothetical protein